ncbi:MAG: transcription antitermination factor NusB [Microbacteriaceae bacterium]|nr:transcription antitermination factor NusB [Microbacteriaceae bacterium]
MSARRKARKRALDVVFSADVNGTELSDALESARVSAERDPGRASSWPYAQEIVEGIIAHGASIDSVLQATSRAWPVERMPAVDRAVLRIALWELLHNDEVPGAVAISEAVDLVNELSTEASAGFVHGILAAVASDSAVS